MPTSLSSTTPYCTAAILLQYHDYRQIADCVLDNGSRPPQSQITDGDPSGPGVSTAGKIVFEYLMWASGQVESACFLGNHYQLADLQALTGGGLSMLRGLVADLCMWKLNMRRASVSGTAYQASDGDKLAFGLLGELREGKRIFPLADQAAAGLTDTINVDIGQLTYNNFTTEQSGRFFGVRADEARTLSGVGTPAVSQ